MEDVRPCIIHVKEEDTLKVCMSLLTYEQANMHRCTHIHIIHKYASSTPTIKACMRAHTNMHKHTHTHIDGGMLNSFIYAHWAYKSP